MGVFLVILLVISKLYYVNIFSLGVYNFTLSDVCLIIFLIQIIFPTKKMYHRDSNKLIIIKQLIFITIGITLLNCITTLLIGSSLLSSIMNIIKRWLSMLIIPMYIYKYIQPNKRTKLSTGIILVICAYTLLNLREIILSGATRYTAEGTANPNIIAGLFGILLIYSLNAEYKTSVKTVTTLLFTFMIFACSSRGAVLALIITFGYYIFLSNIRLDRKIKMVLACVIIAGVGLVLGKLLLPAATDRLVGSFVGGFSQTESYQARMGTLGKLISMMLRNVELLFIGTGFGNGNLQLIAGKYGQLITTADNMYGDLLAWCGLLGLPLIVLYFIKLLKLCEKPSKTNPNSMLFLTVFMLTLGFTQDSLFEPTVGCLYYILWGLELVRSVDSKSLAAR